MFKTILVGTDGSDAAERALIAACKLAQACDAQVHVVHVPKPETVAYAMGAVAGYHMVTTMPHRAEVEEAAAKVTDAATALAAENGVTLATVKVADGDPGDATVGHANDLGADLIVSGRRGLGNLAGLVVGSTSQRITHIAKCAVLTVP